MSLSITWRKNGGFLHRQSGRRLPPPRSRRRPLRPVRQQRVSLSCSRFPCVCLSQVCLGKNYERFFFHHQKWTETFVFLPDQLPAPARNGIFEPFICINDHFAKTGSGQTYGKLQKRCRFSHHHRLSLLLARRCDPQQSRALKLPRNRSLRLRDTPLFLNFSYVRPEPVWANFRFSASNGANVKGVLRIRTAIDAPARKRPLF
jgi:hypothetical protein